MAETIQAFGNLGLLGMILVVLLIGCAMRVTRFIISRAYRMVMVLARGWPPEHLDADGDWKPQPATEAEDD